MKDWLNIDIGQQFHIQRRDLIGKRIAAIGKSGSGKTHTLFVLIEEWLSGGYPATVVDPMGQFRALGDVYPVLIVGRGEHTHVEITPTNAATIAELSLRERISVVLDLGLYRSDEEMPILEAYFQRLEDIAFPQLAPPPYAVVIDEAHMYAPEVGSTPISDTIKSLAKIGRHKNLTTMVATQRAASVDKDFLTQANLLFAHRLTFGIDTAVLREQLPLAPKELNAMMRKLAIGEAVVMGDSEFIGFDDDYLRVQIRQRRAGQLDAVTDFEQSELRPLDQSLLDSLRSALAEPQAADAGNSSDARVAALQAQIYDLRQQLATRQVERVEVPVLPDAQVDAFQQAAAALVALGNKLLMVLDELAPTQESDAGVGAYDDIHVLAGASPDENTGNADQDSQRIKIKAGARRMLNTLARWHPQTLTRQQLATLSGFSQGGTFSDYLGVLRRCGYIVEADGRICVTLDGYHSAGAIGAQRHTAEEIVALWSSELKLGARRMLDILVSHYPASMTRVGLSEASGYAQGGTFSDYLNTLRRKGLIEIDGQRVRAHNTLFMGEQGQ